MTQPTNAELADWVESLASAPLSVQHGERFHLAAQRLRGVEEFEAFVDRIANMPWARWKLHTLRNEAQALIESAALAQLEGSK